TSLYMFLHTGHVPLNKHLHHIHKSDSLFCAHCPGIEETMHHYLITCCHYQRAWHSLITALGHKATSTQFLLTDLSAIPHLVSFVNATSRLRAILGEIPLPHTLLN
ncbi:uncharacterized protein BJ212DRAFT_1280930, partial [Suillus subaureus]